MLVSARDWDQKAGSGSLTPTPDHPLFCSTLPQLYLRQANRDSSIFRSQHLHPTPPSTLRENNASTTLLPQFKQVWDRASKSEALRSVIKLSRLYLYLAPFSVKLRLRVNFGLNGMNRWSDRIWIMKKTESYVYLMKNYKAPGKPCQIAGSRHCDWIRQSDHQQ